MSETTDQAEFEKRAQQASDEIQKILEKYRVAILPSISFVPGKDPEKIIKPTILKPS